jgi:hypothetical protein
VNFGIGLAHHADVDRTLAAVVCAIADDAHAL